MQQKQKQKAATTIRAIAQAGSAAPELPVVPHSCPQLQVRLNMAGVQHEHGPSAKAVGAIDTLPRMVTDVRSAQKPNAQAPTDVTLKTDMTRSLQCVLMFAPRMFTDEGISKLTRWLHSSMNPMGNSTMRSESIVSVCIEEHSRNVPNPTVTTDRPMTAEVKFVQLRKASGPISTTLSGMTTRTRCLAWANASLAMTVKVGGKSTSLIAKQPFNAPENRVVVPEGISATSVVELTQSWQGLVAFARGDIRRAVTAMVTRTRSIFLVDTYWRTRQSAV